MPFIRPRHDAYLEGGVEGMVTGHEDGQQCRGSHGKHAGHQLAQHTVVPATSSGREMPCMGLMMDTRAARRFHDGIPVHVQGGSHHRRYEHRQEQPCSQLSSYIVSHFGDKDKENNWNLSKIVEFFWDVPFPCAASCRHHGRPF